MYMVVSLVIGPSSYFFKEMVQTMAIPLCFMGQYLRNEETKYYNPWFTDKEGKAMEIKV